jgi:hypothetical protein
MTEYVGVLMGLGATAIVGMFTWVFNGLTGLETRVAVLEQGRNDLKELIDTKFDDLGRRLDRIERSLNGHLHRD